MKCKNILVCLFMIVLVLIIVGCQGYIQQDYNNQTQKEINTSVIKENDTTTNQTPNLSLNKFIEKHKEVELSIEWNDKTGTLKNLRPSKGDYNLGISNIEDMNKAKDVAKRFLLEVKDLIKIDISNMNLTKARVGGSELDTYFLTYTQNYKGVPVYNSEVYLVFQKNGNLINSIFDLYPDLNISTEPKISKEQALEIAKEDVKKTGSEMFNESKRTISIEKIFEMSQPTLDEIELVILPIEKEYGYEYHLCWVIRFDIRIAEWIFVDAQTGKVVHKESPLYS